MNRLGRNVVAVSAVASAGLLASIGGSAIASGAESSQPRLQADPPVGPPPAANTAYRSVNTSASPWQRLRNPPPFSPGTMLLASNGDVLVHSEPFTGGTPDWYELVPDANGSYVNGTWKQIASMPKAYDPLYFASAILPDGRMIVEGGEYLGGTPTWTDKGAIYDPVTNTWRSVAPPSGWTGIGDAQSIVLANGTYMLSQVCNNCLSPNFQLTNDAAVFNETGDNWLVVGAAGKSDPTDEESWTLEPSGQVLTVDTWLTPTTELFNPANFSWSFAGNTRKSPVNTPGAEVGPSVLLPNGNVFVVGAGTSTAEGTACTIHSAAPTALYDYAAGKWVASPSIPTIGGLQNDSADGPASVLPDGNVLFDVSPCVYDAPLSFDLYNPATNSISSVPDVPNADNDSSYNTRLLNLPNGQILFNDGSRHMLVYTAGGTPQASWQPSITGLSSTSLKPGGTYNLSGVQLAGVTMGSTYGDDVQDSTNYPLVRIVNDASGAVTYARTSRWANVSVAPGATSSTNFTLPVGTPAGRSNLYVVANGIASAYPIPVTVTASPAP